MSVQLWDPDSDVEVHAPTFAALVVVLLAAVIGQVSVVARLPLPGGHPDLVLLLLAAAALVEGPVVGALLGFTAGLFGDLLSTHVLGRSALVLCLVGYLVGLVAEATERSVLVALAAISGAVAAGSLGNVLVAVLLGDGAPTEAGPVLLRALTAALYAALLTPFLFPAVVAGVRRTRRVRRR
ncbi:rod shape-determining protein MreD [Frankia sp. CNm7]|uniref:Rod shape-determining protein MreD n=1 Tax=Frankia nepalensis TaxID=1836974 RepID=A0A937RBF0_9ACTN|nr:rod shape-determining protein MreD [Frankia nepalensis]MBL7497206.1 rod shape-determining protein MreD [Frankia nepalensis]MBL7510359.1 rod shape-determining protein MreD [Frankia nepalensis]MBL7522685.1 rod shape-determining protein MreD [Frankia nepalensis]MBL7626697.1 rod shape-determining protein MreD [Frankia nepalensis]